MIEVASVRRLGAHDRLEYWNDLIGATYPGMSVNTQAELFDAKLSVWHLSDLRMVKPLSTPAIVTRQPRSQAVYSEPKFVAHTLVRGKVSLDQRGRRATLNEGDMVICASDEYYRFETHTTHEMMVVEVDAATLADKLPNIDDFVARPISGKLTSTRLLRRYMDSLWLEARATAPEQHWDLHAGILTDLIVASLQSSDDGLSCPGDPLFKRMQDIIDERLDEFDFGPVHLSADMGIPLRTLQATAARAGTTIGQMITTHRLQRAAQLLLTRPDQPVTQVALDCGFADPSYFARRFQQALGTSPRKFRLCN